MSQIKKALTGKRKSLDTNILYNCAFALAGFLAAVYLALHATAIKNTNFMTSLILGIYYSFISPKQISIGAITFIYILVYGILIIGTCYYIYLDSKKRERWDKNSGGNAKWYTNYKKFKKKYTDVEHPENNLLLTQNIALSMESFKTRRNNNILVVGGPGSGKTRFVIKPNLMQANCSFVVTDPKGEILEAEAGMLEKKGYRIKVFNLTDMEHSNSYNPFKYIRDNLGVLIMINCLIANTNNGQKGGDPFWEKSETILLQALVFYLIENKEIPEDQKNFTAIMRLLQEAEIDEKNPDKPSALDNRMKKHESIYENSQAVKAYKAFKIGAGKTLKSILISCNARLAVFNLPEIENLTMSDDLDLMSIGDEKTALFVVIPAADDTYNFLVSMMYSQLFESLYFRAENQCPYEYYIKDGSDILAIARNEKNPEDNSEKKAEELRRSICNARIQTRIVNREKIYLIKTKNFEKTFHSKEEAMEFQSKIKKGKIGKGKIRLPYPVRFLLDEFANIGQIPNFTKKLATMRSYEISCTIILQNLAQIKTAYKDDWESIVGNCDSFLFLGGQEYSTLEYLSKLLGKKTIMSRNYSRSRSAKGGNYSQSDSNQGKNLMDPNDISTMPKDECILIINGLDPFRDKKYDLTKHPNYGLTADGDKANRFDCKKKIFNYGARLRKNQKELKAEEGQASEKELENMKPVEQNIFDLMQDKLDKDPSELIMTKGEVVIGDKNSEPEFDYNYSIE